MLDWISSLRIPDCFRRNIHADILLSFFPDYTKGQLDQCKKRADSCVDVLGRYTEDEVPNKHLLLSTLFSCLGNCDMQTKRYTGALENHGHDLLIGEQW